MLKVWGRATSSNVQKVMWLIGELDIEHERVDVGGAFGGVDTPAYLSMNPNGLVPTVEDDGVVIWESHAIVRYLAAKHGRGSLWPADLGASARADMWMDWMHTTVQKDWIAVFMGLVRTPPSKRDMSAIDAAVARLGETYRTVDSALAGRDYLAGGTLTMADIPIGTSLYRYFSLDIARPTLPNLEAWYQRLVARPAYAQHVMVSYESLRVSD